MDADPRSARRDEGAVDTGRGRVPRRILRLPAGAVVPEAGAKAASAHRHRGSAKNVLKRIVDHADGWLPNRVTPSDLEKARKELDRLALASGRDPKSITISV